MKIVGKSNVDGKLIVTLDEMNYKISNIDHWGRCYVVENIFTIDDRIKRKKKES